MMTIKNLARIGPRHRHVVRPLVRVAGSVFDIDVLPIPQGVTSSLSVVDNLHISNIMEIWRNWKL